MILFNDKYKGLKYMLNVNRRYGLRNCKLYVNIVMTNLTQAMFLNINNLNDFKINHYKCKYEKIFCSNVNIHIIQEYIQKKELIIIIL